MSLADDPQARINFQVRCGLVVRSIEDLRAEIWHAQNGQPPLPALTHLGWADLHLAEAIEEIHRASAQIGLI